MNKVTLTKTEKVIDAVLRKNLLKGRAVIIYPSGARCTYGKGTPKTTIHVNKLSMLKLRNPAMFVGEAYMHGDIHIPEEELLNFFAIMSQNPIQSNSLNVLQKLPKRQRNSYRTQRKHIKHHYDLGNDYYRLWLDTSLTYSCAYFKKPTDTLEKAQQQKNDYLLRKLQLRSGQTLLDIGCGWGNLCVTAAKRYGVKAYGITLSEEQLAGAKELAKKEGVSHLVTFELKNYQDLNDQTFDRIISVGMYEHVGRGNHADYFKKIDQLLVPGGVSVLHTITDQALRPASPWIDKYIFPGGYLPTIASIEELLSEYRFWSIDRENLWQHYARTLDIWRKRHTANRDKIIAMYDEVFYRQQDFWLAGSTAAFSHGDNGLNQFVFSKGKPAFDTWPLTRENLYK
jgi:cyclopropane-fatty-acyl-phospholipid synthase